MPLIPPKPKPEPKPESPYLLHSQIAKFFQEFVTDPFEKHEATKAWKREVATQNWSYQASLIDNGRSSFSEPKNGLSPGDLVLIYCYRYMQMHTVSGFHVLYRNLQDRKLEILRNPVFIDFGCGPLTCGISLAWYNLVVRKHKTPSAPDGLRVHYIGIDRSEAMLAHAQAASLSSGLFHSKATFDFISRKNLPTLLPGYIKKYREANGNKELTVILNCSYYFGSRTLDVKALVSVVKNLLTEHLQDDKVCLVYQNATHPAVNEKWEEFKKGMKALLPSVSDDYEEIQYHDVTGRKTQNNPQTIKLRRGLLLNTAWSDHLAKGNEK
ncbi:MAG: hypothetical protein C0467_23205 [Planctomycetaceae bacterium]|nr:hypothetical protein [Planctomycetaceae bacterium]